MEKEILQGDGDYRRKFIVKTAILYTVALAAGCLLIFWGRPWLRSYLDGLEPRAALNFLTWSLTIIFLSILPVCAFFFRFGQKIVRAQRFPLPGTKVIRDTEVLRGDRAVARGRLFIGIALVVAALALVSAVFFPYWLNRLAASQPRFQKTTPGHGLLV
ncbi:MAG: hypothetical protein QME75_07860 [Deltaproteobacteria bacterium]|nr:hypothetical protein [Deltaproteobacteria bacterium]